MIERLAPAAGRAKAAGRSAYLMLAMIMANGAAWPALACPAPPAPIRDIALPRFYADKAGSVVDAELAEAHREAVEPINDFLRHVVSDADKAWRRSKPDAQAEVGTCAATWIAAWAKGRAWLGRMETRQSEYQRKWDHAGVSLAYLKVRRFATPAERAVIEPWLIELADAARAFFDDPERRRNNHWYWLGLGLGATGLATGSEKHWAMARGIFEDASRDIQANGTLPHEMERKGRALFYHAFSATPLVTLAELAASRGEDWWAIGNGASHRLVKATLDGLADPTPFEVLAGEKQERPLRTGSGWIALYTTRFPDRIPGQLPQSAPGHRWLGGDVLVLKAALGQSR